MNNELFSYTTSLFLNWHKELSDKKNENDLSKLKLIKLHFFLCTVEPKLLTDFKFLAMKFGPVNSEFLDSINTHQIPGFNINNSCSSQVSEVKSIPIEDKRKIDNAFKNLKSKNENLILYSAFDLVDISHRWTAWAKNYKFAQLLGKKSLQIPDIDIINEPIKHYAL